MNRQKQDVIYSVAVSFLLHAVFIGVSIFYVFPGVGEMTERTKNMFHIAGVDDKAADVNFVTETEPLESVKMTRQAAPEEVLEFPSMMYKPKPEDVKPDNGHPKGAVTPEDVKPAPMDMVKAEGADLKKEAAPQARPILGKLSEAKLENPDIDKPAGSRMGSDAVRQSFIYPESENGEMAMPKGEGGAFQPGEGDLAALEGNARLGHYEDINKYLDIVLTTYEDQAGEKYFKLSVSVKKGVNFRVIPKEVIFLVDSSKSITEEKLSFFKTAILSALRGLNAGDRVNLVAFREGTTDFSEKSVEAGGKPMRDMELFIKQLQSVGQTDVNNALLEITKRPVTFTPSYIIMMTDGRPTVGEMDPKRIIREITRQNDLKRPLFCFGGGFRVNRYLLEFISYQNRAWSDFAASSNEIARDFHSFFAEIKDPILVNVRYRVSKIDVGQIFPKDLPDFYLSKPFVLYGRFTDKQDIFSTQILGEIDGSLKELIFSMSLKNAEKGGADIARDWAFRKVYYLISRITMGTGDKDAMLAEISELSKKYGITTPYGDDYKAGK